MSFDLAEEIRGYDAAEHGKPYSPRTPDADLVLVDCEHDPSSLSVAAANGVLNRIFDAIVEDPENVTLPENLDSIRFILIHAYSVPTPSLDKLLELMTAGLATEAENAQADLDQDKTDSVQDHRLRLEIFAFHLQWLLNAVDERFRAAERQGPARPGKKTKKDTTSWDPSPRIVAALKTMSDLLHRVKLSKIFVTTADRDTFIKLVTTPVYFLLEHEKRVKQDRNFRQHTYKVLCAAVKEHGHGYSAQTIIYQRLTNYKHLFEPMAEFVHILANEYAYPQLAEDVLRDLSSREYGPAETEGPRSIGEFISKLSDLNPRLVIKQFPLLKALLDAEPYPLRNSIISVCQDLIAMLHRDLVNLGDVGTESDAIENNIQDYLDLLDARFMDVSHYCRCKTISEYTKILDLDHFDFAARRQTTAELACRSLEDKSSQVRINAIKLLTKLVETHPFRRLYQAQLSLSAYQARLEEIDAEMERVRPTGQDLDSMVNSLVDQPTQMSPAKEPTAEAVERAEKNAEAYAACKQIRRLVSDAIAFIEVVDAASKAAIPLLGAKSKSEVIATMNFFRKTYAHGVESAHVGLRRMLRLIWTKGASEEGKNVPDHLIECYQEFFFIPPPGYSPDQAACWIARNMVSLTYDSTQADLTSLEKLLSTMVSDGKIAPLVTDKLWDMYRVQADTSRKQRRGVINVLGMLTLADPDIVVREMETCLEIGLGRQGVKDLVLARYTCVALMRMNANAKTRGAKAPTMTRLDNSHMVLQRLQQMILRETDSSDWYAMAEQALGTIYVLSNHPDVLCTEIIRHKTKSVFAMPDPDAMEVDGPASGQTLALSQLLFIVGHVAIKQIVHLELCEQDFKRRKAAKAEEARQRAEEEDEMDMIAGNEDEFADAVQAVREQELLFGPQSILTQFGPMVREICANDTRWANKDLQAQAALCMAKLMCVSSLYCSDNLDLMIKILGRSKDATTRSNLVIAFADMLACFNHLLDKETNKIFNRLSDSSLSVRRTCLLTLTFLVLAGQIKVKGHLGKMAKCIEAEDEWTREMSRMFFAELSGKDNAVYNNFLDMISTLSADESLSEDQFKKIAKFVSAFVEGDKQTKQLAARLAFKLQRAADEKEWSYYAHVLGLLPHKDEEIAKVIGEGYKTVESQEIKSQTAPSQGIPIVQVQVAG